VVPGRGAPVRWCQQPTLLHDSKGEVHWTTASTRFRSHRSTPDDCRKGRTRSGKISEHTLENTGPRRFLVIEFDKGTLDQQAALLFHLSKFAPSLALVVFSGSRSLHGWFYCANQTEEAQLR